MGRGETRGGFIRSLGRTQRSPGSQDQSSGCSKGANSVGNGDTQMTKGKKGNLKGHWSFMWRHQKELEFEVYIERGFLSVWIISRLLY